MRPLRQDDRSGWYGFVGRMSPITSDCDETWVLPVVLMFHANAWGVPFACAATGAAIVLRGPRLDPVNVLGLLARDGVTTTAARRRSGSVRRRTRRRAHTLDLSRLVAGVADASRQAGAPPNRPMIGGRSALRIVRSGGRCGSLNG